MFRRNNSKELFYPHEETQILKRMHMIFFSFHEYGNRYKFQSGKAWGPRSRSMGQPITALLNVDTWLIQLSNLLLG